MQDKPNAWRPWILSLLIAVMPVSFALPLKAKALPAAILLLVGLWLLATDAETRRAFRRARLVLVPVALAFAFWLGNTLLHGIPLRQFDVMSHILAFLPIAACFAAPLRPIVLRLGFSASAAALGLICMEQHYIEGIDRAYGINNGLWGAIEFGMFILVLSLMGIVQALRLELRPGERIMHGLFAAMGFYGALLTQSRGPLLACIPVVVLLVVIQARRTGRWRQALGVLVLGVLVVGIATTTLHGEVAERFAKVSEEMSTYSESDTTGAVRERIEMWRNAGSAVAEHPLTGVGLNQFGTYARGRIAEGKAADSIEQYDHPHSEYLEWAVTGGIPALALLLLMFGASLWFFGRHAMHRDNGIAMPACAGLAVTGMYALCGLTDNVFYRAMPHSLYFFLTLGLAVYIGRMLSLRESLNRGP
ncbi:MAG TPA: O-antigen ligase family protein [Luteibacter sp.]|uniref:O-antigen ligase family protein n=1 Tax=Luteibacter sp. TaxID=1886636 RepID=UPI002F3E9CC7